MSNSFVFKKSGFENNNKLKTSKDWGGYNRIRVRIQKDRPIAFKNCYEESYWHQ